MRNRKALSAVLIAVLMLAIWLCAMFAAEKNGYHPTVFESSFHYGESIYGDDEHGDGYSCVPNTSWKEIRTCS